MKATVFGRISELFNFVIFMGLTDSGYQYHVYLNGSAGIDYGIHANNMGNILTYSHG